MASTWAPYSERFDAMATSLLEHGTCRDLETAYQKTSDRCRDLAAKGVSDTKQRRILLCLKMVKRRAFKQKEEGAC